MISYESYCKIHDYAQQQGLTVAQIALEMRLDPKTVAKWIKAKSFTQRQSTPRHKAGSV